MIMVQTNRNEWNRNHIKTITIEIIIRNTVQVCKRVGCRFVHLVWIDILLVLLFSCNIHVIYSYALLILIELTFTKSYLFSSIASIDRITGQYSVWLAVHTFPFKSSKVCLSLCVYLPYFTLWLLIQIAH